MPPTRTDAGSRWMGYAILAISVVIVSSSSILIRFAQADAVPSLAIAAWRMTLAAIVLGGAMALNARGGQQIAPSIAKDYGMALTAGGFLGLHSATWFASPAYTPSA